MIIIKIVGFISWRVMEDLGISLFLIVGYDLDRRKE